MIAGLDSAGRLPSGVVVGTALLAAGGLLAESGRVPLWLHPVLVVPGAWYVAAHVLDGSSAARVALGVAIAGGGLALGEFDRRWRERAWSPVLCAVSVVGVLAAVPDTERALVLAGAAIPLVLLGWPVPLASLGRAGAWATVGVAAGVIVTDGAGRPGSMVGAAGCIGLLLVEPLARGLRRGDSPLAPLARRVGSPTVALAAVAVVHLVLVVVASRVAGLRKTVGEALPIVSALLVVAVVLAVWLAPRERRAQSPATRREDGEPLLKE